MPSKAPTRYKRVACADKCGAISPATRDAQLRHGWSIWTAPGKRTEELVCPKCVSKRYAKLSVYPP